MAACLWGGFAPFLHSPHDHSRSGALHLRLLAASGLTQPERNRLTALGGATGEAEAAREFARAAAVVAAAPAPDAVALAPGIAAEVAAAAAAAAELPWRILHRHQRAGVEWLAGRHLAGVGAIVADRVGAGKRLTILSHLLHLRESLGLKGPHLLLCPPGAIPGWTAEINRWCPKLRAVTLTSAAEERTPAKATALRNGTFDILIVPVMMMIEAGVAAAEAEAADVEAAASAAAAQSNGADAAEEGDAAAVEAAEAMEAAKAAEAARKSTEATGGKKAKKRSKAERRRDREREREREREQVDRAGGAGLPTVLTRMKFRCLVVDADGQEAAAMLPALTAAAAHKRVTYSHAVVVSGALVERAAHDTVGVANLRAALTLLFPEVLFSDADTAAAASIPAVGSMPSLAAATTDGGNAPDGGDASSGKCTTADPLGEEGGGSSGGGDGGGAGGEAAGGGGFVNTEMLGSEWGPALLCVGDPVDSTVGGDGGDTAMVAGSGALMRAVVLCRNSSTELGVRTTVRETVVAVAMCPSGLQLAQYLTALTRAELAVAAAVVADADIARDSSAGAEARELVDAFAALQRACSSPALRIASPQGPQELGGVDDTAAAAWGDAAAVASAKLGALDALLPRLRAERRAALVVSSSHAALDAAAALLSSRRVAHFRLDSGGTDSGGPGGALNSKS
jgi:SWI/SNF-related matrix-associated actin-dependent regulator of chromatin subfamily A member 5